MSGCGSGCEGGGETEQTRAALDIMGKAFALLEMLSGARIRRAVRQVSEDTFDLLQPVTGVKKACELTGKSRATVYRRRWHPSGCRERRPASPNALSPRAQELLAHPGQSPFADKAPRQVWAVLIDEGAYLASVSTMYRLLREAGRSASAARRPPTRPARSPSSSPVRPMKCGPGTLPSWRARSVACITTCT